MKSAVNSRGSIYSETEGSICLKCPHERAEAIYEGIPIRVYRNDLLDIQRSWVKLFVKKA
jgi:hypothetical protein